MVNVVSVDILDFYFLPTKKKNQNGTEVNGHYLTYEFRIACTFTILNSFIRMLNLDFGPQSSNGAHATHVSVQESAGINDTGGGGGDSGGGLLATFCAAFCKDNPLGEQFGVNQTSTATTTQLEPITSQSKTLTCLSFSTDRV